MRIGPVELSAVKDWDPAPGVLVSWHPTPASCAKALAAPVSAVPPSYVQARQIRSFSEQAARGLDHSRLLIASVEVFGHCDLRAMTYVINNSSGDRSPAVSLASQRPPRLALKAGTCGADEECATS